MNSWVVARYQPFVDNPANVYGPFADQQTAFRYILTRENQHQYDVIQVLGPPIGLNVAAPTPREVAVGALVVDCRLTVLPGLHLVFTGFRNIAHAQAWVTGQDVESGRYFPAYVQAPPP